MKDPKKRRKEEIISRGHFSPHKKPTQHIELENFDIRNMVIGDRA